MHIECKYCGEPESFWNIVLTRIKTGSLPDCSNCGADDDTIEIADPESE